MSPSPATSVTSHTPVPREGNASIACAGTSSPPTRRSPNSRIRAVLHASWHSGEHDLRTREMQRNPAITLMMAHAAALCAGFSSAASKRNPSLVVARVGSNVTNSATRPPKTASMQAPRSNWQTVRSGFTIRTMFPSSHPECSESLLSFCTASWRISIQLTMIRYPGGAHGRVSRRALPAGGAAPPSSTLPP
ncbi:MAG: hypothetical protein A4E40_01250 [Methanoregulaceae archaeon PtaU1.Bin059]|nr:MAG: hypothetical protein A4E40_01250 [Methanoregulaceae archaeon PtaU1.Bin059]